MSSAPAPVPSSWQPSPALLDDVTVATLAMDRDGRLVYANAAAVTLFGVSRPDLLGAVARDVLCEEQERGAVDEITARVLHGSPWTGELTLVCAGRHPRELATSWTPTHAPGTAEVAGVLLVAEDTQHTRILTHRLDRLGSVSADLVTARTISDIASVVTEHMTDAAGATVGSMSLLVDGDTLALVGIRGGTDGVASRWATYPVAGRTPAADCMRSRRPLLLEGRAEIAARYPDLERAAEGERSIVCLPLLIGDRDLGVMSLSFPGRRRFDVPELRFLELLAGMTAHTIDRIHAQAAAGDREAKLRFLADASARLSSDLDYRSTLTAVAEAAVPWFADWCVISLADDGRLRTIAVAHTDPAYADLVSDVQTRYPADPGADRGLYRVLRTGEPELVPEVTETMLQGAAVDDEHLRLLRQLSFSSVLVCPLTVRDRVLGVITWVTGVDGRRFDADDLAFGEDLARRAAVAIDNAELHSQLRDVALRLQHAVLPERLPEVTGWETAVVYLPSGRTDAGGDFYDVVDLGGGRIAAFVGDVMGRGVEAASVMAQMRSAIRTLIALDPDPAQVMSGLDQVFARLHLEHLVTIAYAVVDGDAELIHLVSAGHPDPLLLCADGRLEVVTPERTMILGADGGERSVVTRPFHPGDAVLLFTDGLVERRGEDADVGTERLVAACRATDRDPLGDFVRLVVDEVRDPTRDDDVAALAVRRR